MFTLYDTHYRVGALDQQNRVENYCNKLLISTDSLGLPTQIYASHDKAYKYG